MRDIQYIEWCSNKKEFYFLFYFYIWILLAFFTIFLNRFTININSRIMNHAFTMCYNYNILIFWYYYSCSIFSSIFFEILLCKLFFILRLIYDHNFLQMFYNNSSVYFFKIGMYFIYGEKIIYYNIMLRNI